MITSQTSSRNQVFPLHQAVAYIVGVITILFPPMFYWQYGPSLFGPSPLIKLWVIAGVGGALSFALYAGRKRWPIGSMLGFVAGLGASGLHVLYTTVFHKESMLTTESGLVVLLGAGPAMALLAFILRRDRFRQALAQAPK